MYHDITDKRCQCQRECHCQCHGEIGCDHIIPCCGPGSTAHQLWCRKEDTEGFKI